MKKQSLKFIVHSLILVCPVLIFVIFFEFYKQSHFQTSRFLDIESPRIDSLLKNMTLDEKIELLFIADFGQQSDETDFLNSFSAHNYSGVFFETDSLSRFGKITGLLQNKTRIAPFCGIKSYNSYPGFISDIPFIPDSLQFESLCNDSLLNEYVSMLSFLYKKSGINFIFLNSLLADTIGITDTTLFKFKLEKIKKKIHSFSEKQIVTICELPDFKNSADSTSVSFILPLIDSLSNYNITGISFSKIYKFNQGGINSHVILNKSNFYGLSLLNLENKKVTKDLLKDGFENNIDLIILEKNKIEEAKTYINELIARKELDVSNIDSKVKRILQANTWAGLDKKTEIYPDTINHYFHHIRTTSIARNIEEQTALLLTDSGNLIPFQDIQMKFKILYNGISPASFTEQCEQYANTASEKINFENYKLNHKDSVVYIILVNTKLSEKSLQFIRQAGKIRNTIFINFKYIENLRYLSQTNHLIHIFGNTGDNQKIAAQILFGGIVPKSKLPEILPGYSTLQGITDRTQTRLRYSIPEVSGLNPDVVKNIDSIVNDALQKYVFPGCQVFVAKNGNVIYNKAFGSHIYEKYEKVQTDDLYDIASVTKIAATTTALMKMYDSGKLSLDDKLERFFKNTKIEYTKIKPDTIVLIDTFNIRHIKDINKAIKKRDTLYLNDSILIAYDTIIRKVTPRQNIFQCQLKDMLIHKSGLPPSMPILRFILYSKDSVFLKRIRVEKDSALEYMYVKPKLKNRRDSLQFLFQKYYTRKFIKDSAETQISDNLYLRNEYFDTLWIDTKQIKVYNKAIYEYSDVNFIILQQAIDSLNGFGINKYLDSLFFNPLGMHSTTFRPLEKFQKEKIAPTEEDKFWRGHLVQGTVHDESAALMGGVSGNAGLFSCAKDLGIMYQMILNKGTYGGKKYLKNSTISMFTSKQPDSYRGLGFDMYSENQIIAPSASVNSYGHTGFTGCCVWIDPDNELVYVFLSNRVYPSRKNYLIGKYQVRQQIHQAVYNAIKSITYDEKKAPEKEL